MAFDGPRQTTGRQRKRASGRHFSFETRIRLYCLLLCLPTIVLLVILLWRASFGAQALSLGVAILLLLLLSSLLIEEVVRPLQTLANVVAALREEDYSFRARGASREDALGELSTEINALADLLQTQRLSELEATALLRRVIASMDAPVLAFDQERRLRLLNPAAERVLVLDPARDMGRAAGQLHLDHLIDEPDEGVVSLDLPSEDGSSAPRKSGRWMVRRSGFRQRGVPHTLLLLSDVSSALREEERTAWQRLIRVLGHEISNSLAPIKSIAGSLLARLPPEVNGARGAGDFARGLTIIEGRADSLNRFVQAYRQLAQLPRPAMRMVALRPLLERVVALETRMEVALGEVADLDLSVDPDQIEQMLINLVKNAVEAVIDAQQEAGSSDLRLPAPPPVMLSGRKLEDAVAIVVEDRGLGLTNTANLFVPFYTTKTNGSGVGLALVRQIAEAHGGTVVLRNREDAPGCVAEVLIPFTRAVSSSHAM
ncbi:Sensor histidine kinase [Acidisarcina polymorpha]|uniref:histidine kinase n=1 Tax=Acidisarcina polymorpha TaxID=2211140 RepID=A0A2Z5G6Q0_9BACT|nr:ATP-binding protein [Acidisarcina polymorpha]AXC14226.1 Sensor histidine kinase [Acidisarcina polymorpha]